MRILLALILVLSLTQLSYGMNVMVHIEGNTIIVLQIKPYMVPNTFTATQQTNIRKIAKPYAVVVWSKTTGFVAARVYDTFTDAQQDFITAVKALASATTVKPLIVGKTRIKLTAAKILAMRQNNNVDISPE